MVPVNGVQLCVQEFGEPGDPAVLLLGGAAMSMDWWDDGFCERLAAAGRRVVRFDTRDTGRSTTWPAGRPGYAWTAIAADLLALIDRLGLAPVHLVGISMGGAMAQEFALDHPDLVASITLIATSSVGEHQPGLPGSEDRLKAAFELPPPDWTDRAAYVEHSVTVQRLFGGPAGQDEARLRALAGRVFDRTADIEAAETNHWVLVASGDGEEPGPPRRLADLTVPALVLHGTHDPMFPLPHGRALAADIPGATLVVLDGMGHEVPPPPVWDEAVAAIVAVTG